LLRQTHRREFEGQYALHFHRRPPSSVGINTHNRAAASADSRKRSGPSRTSASITFPSSAIRTRILTTPLTLAAFAPGGYTGSTFLTARCWSNPPATTSVREVAFFLVARVAATISSSVIGSGLNESKNFLTSDAAWFARVSVN